VGGRLLPHRLGAHLGRAGWRRTDRPRRVGRLEHRTVRAELVSGWAEARGATAPASRSIGQIPISWDPDAAAAEARAHEQFRWFGAGWTVNADLPTTAGFAGASQFVRPEDVSASIPCGPDLDAIVEAVRPYWEAGFTDIALVQVGDEMQQRFLDEAAGPLLEKLRSASA
jgi:G6PDH family F420-dependent oxidoreductase